MLQKFEGHHPKETIFYSYPHTIIREPLPKLLL